MIISVSDIGYKTIVAKGGNAGYQHFSPTLALFSLAFPLRDVKTGDCVIRGSIVITSC